MRVLYSHIKTGQFNPWQNSYSFNAKKYIDCHMYMEGNIAQTSGIHIIIIFLVNWLHYALQIYSQLLKIYFFCSLRVLTCVCASLVVCWPFTHPNLVINDQNESIYKSNCVEKGTKEQKQFTKCVVFFIFGVCYCCCCCWCYLVCFRSCFDLCLSNQLSAAQTPFVMKMI